MTLIRLVLLGASVLFSSCATSASISTNEGDQMIDSAVDAMIADRFSSMTEVDGSTISTDYIAPSTVKVHYSAGDPGRGAANYPIDVISIGKDTWSNAGASREYASVAPVVDVVENALDPLRRIRDARVVSARIDRIMLSSELDGQDAFESEVVLEGSRIKSIEFDYGEAGKQRFEFEILNSDEVIVPPNQPREVAPEMRCDEFANPRPEQVFCGL